MISDIAIRLISREPQMRVGKGPSSSYKIRQGREERGWIGNMKAFSRTGYQPKTFAISAPISHASIRPIFRKLLFGPADDLGSLAIHFIFPPDQAGLRKPLA